MMTSLLKCKKRVPAVEQSRSRPGWLEDMGEVNWRQESPKEDKMRQCIIDKWERLDKHVIDNAI